MVRFDSWRAVSAGNRADRNLATKSTYGGRAIWRAVTRVKLEQASKAAMWTPTRRKTGEGRTDGEEPGAGARHHDNRRALIGSTGVVSTARRKGNRASVGEARDGRGTTPADCSHPAWRWWRFIIASGFVYSRWPSLAASCWI